MEEGFREQVVVRRDSCLLEVQQAAQRLVKAYHKFREREVPQLTGLPFLIAPKHTGLFSGVP